MKQLEALTISIGVLGAVDTWFTAVVFPLPVWVTFIAWASFVIVGGGTQGWVRSVACNLTGIVIASITLFVIGLLPESALIAAILVGLGSAAMVQASKLAPIAGHPRHRLGLRVPGRHHVRHRDAGHDACGHRAPDAGGRCGDDRGRHVRPARRDVGQRDDRKERAVSGHGSVEPGGNGT